MSSSVLLTCSLKVNLLGSVELVSETAQPDLAQAQLRVLLATLALSANHVVSIPALTDALWQEEPSQRRQRNLHAHVYQLRRRLATAEPGGDSRLARAAHGYRLALHEDDLDAAVFSTLATEGRRLAAADHYAAAAQLLGRALDQWRGPALADVAQLSPRLAAEAARLDELRIAVAETWVECHLATSQHSEVLAELIALARTFPLRERLAGQLMLALYRSARRSEALAVFDRTRRLLGSDLGLDPGPMLAALHLQILRDDPDLLSPGRTNISLEPPAGPRLRGRSDASVAAGREAGGAGLAAAFARVPQQLPAAVPHFAGRSAELAELDKLRGRLAGPARDQEVQPATTVFLTGMAGVGKTTLAVAWARSAAGRFPDGQLYVDLRGHDPAEPVAPARAISWMLAALVSQPERIPADEHSLASAYRTLISGRRMLIVLDNATDAEQVRLLLPAGPGPLVIVISRFPLTGLADAVVSTSIRLGPLAPAQARQLLEARLGHARVSTEHAAAAEIARECTGLPLALAIVAARAAASPTLSLHALAGQLRGVAERTDPLDAIDAAPAIREVFSWSARQLGGTAARMLALLACHCGPDISIAAAASLATLTRAEAELALTELANAGLVYQHRPGRFVLHDLVRDCAAERAAETLGTIAIRAAASRGVDHYLQTAAAVPWAYRIKSVSSRRQGVVPEQLTDAGEAIAWLRAEQWVLLRAIGWAASHDLGPAPWQLLVLMAVVLAQEGRWEDWAEAGRVALAAATRASDDDGISRVHRTLALRAQVLGNRDDAAFHNSRALEFARKTGDVLGQANSHLSIAQSIQLAGHGLHDAAETSADASAEGLMHARHAADLFRQLGDKHGEGLALACLGDHHSRSGQHELAADYCSSAIELQIEAGSGTGQRYVWHTLGWVHRRRGSFDVAARCYEQALRVPLDRSPREDWYRALVLTHLGDALQAAGDSGSARGAWQQAVAVLDELRHPEADAVAARLRPSGAG
jgi:DNA-binding SARP family transcriptional activator